MQILALLSSMPFESNRILSRLKYIRSVKIAGKTAHKGKLPGINVILMNTGIGPINAAHAATCIIEKYSVGKILTLGIGGAYPGSGLGIGDIAIASKEIYGDHGVFTSKGLQGMQEIGIPLVREGKKIYFNEYPLHVPVHKEGTVCGKNNFKIKTGRFVTVSAATGTLKRAAGLKRRFKALCENMEGAAIAQICAIYKIPMIEIRGISNIVGVRDKRKWNVTLASVNCQEIALRVAGNNNNLLSHR